jgi:hypothetical protein
MSDFSDIGVAPQALDRLRLIEQPGPEGGDGDGGLLLLGDLADLFAFRQRRRRVAGAQGAAAASARLLALRPGDPEAAARSRAAPQAPGPARVRLVGVVMRAGQGVGA